MAGFIACTDGTATSLVVAFAYRLRVTISHA